MKSKVMTAMITCMILCMSLISFASCSSKNFEVYYLTDTNVTVEKEDIPLLTSQDELNVYKDSSRFIDAKSNVTEKMESYSSDFFNDRMLIVINLLESTGSSKITVEKIDYGDTKATISLKRKVMNVSDDSIKIWSIFIETVIQEIQSVKYVFE